MLISKSSHCALIIVIELALNYDKRGVSLEEIAQWHHLPVEDLSPVAERLCAVGIISCEQMGDQTRCLFLKRQPEELFAYDVVQIFDSEIFMGKFLNETNGRWFAASKATQYINFERKQYIHYMRKKLKKLNIQFWCEKLQQS